MRSLPLLALAVLVSAAAADAPPTQTPAPYRMGVNYFATLPAQPSSAPPGQIEVMDFFWYGCPFCNHFEPYLEAWERSKPANVVLVRVPALLKPEWEPAARAYYTAEALGILAKSHAATFDEIHKNHDVMQTEQDFERFFVKQFGVDPKQFEAAWTSRAMEAKLAQARVLGERYNLALCGVPTLVVNGKWITGGDASLFNLQYPQIMPAVSYLVSLELAAMPASAK